MKTFYLSGGLFFIIFICLIPLKRKIQEYNVQKNGTLVTATITNIPNCIGARLRPKFAYDGQKFDKKVGCGFADTYNVGDEIRFKHIAGTDVFLFENEKIESEFIAGGILFVFGVILVVMGIRRK